MDCFGSGYLSLYCRSGTDRGTPYHCISPCNPLHLPVYNERSAHMVLHYGCIHFKATKQHTVTTSSTEAELLTVSLTVKELMWWKRFFTVSETARSSASVLEVVTVCCLVALKCMHPPRKATSNSTISWLI